MSVENENTLVQVEPQGEVRACVIWLHGLGADGFDFQPIIPYLKLAPDAGVRFIFPHAEVMPVTVNGGMPMRAWYDILEMNIDRKVDKASLLSSSERIQHLIDRQIAEGIPADKIVLAGFSQGGAVAYQTALCCPQRLAGLLALSTYMATAEEIGDSLATHAAELPVWVAHGTLDDVVPLQLGEQAVAHLQQMGLKPEWQTYPMGHEVSLPQIEQIGRWIEARLGA
ncbi:alpha/beta hydrolase [Neptuniibacter halophilus]|uniref:alpha/beta hydrolase n=1 Tax=Neptuniibacter halophilus TaxID=651666 RepID=UPI002572A0EB|nr:carboxylesterase [Neptuniibacter halophilus]